MAAFRTEQTAPLVGRAEELAALRRLLVKSTSEGSQVAVIEGEAGIGKSRLLDETARVARGLGFEVRRAGAGELAGLRPFGTIADAFGVGSVVRDAARDRIARLLGEAAATGGNVQFRVLEEITGMVEAEALQGKLLLGLEDLQWADASTLLAVESICRRVRHLPLVTIVTFRPTPRTPALERLRGTLQDRSTIRIELGALDSQAISELLQRLLGATPQPKLQEAAHGAGGNPLFLIELVRAIQAEGALVASDDGVELRDGTLPFTLRAALLQRLGYLRNETVEMLRIASLLGSAFAVANLAVVMARPAFELLPSLREALAAGMLAERGDQLRFRHELIRGALYDDIPEAIRATLHLEAARRMADAGIDPLQIAGHVLRGPSHESGWSVRWLLETAVVTTSRAPGAAAQLLEHALTRIDPSDPIREAAQARLVGALFSCGRVQEAEALAWKLLTGSGGTSWTSQVRLGLVMALVNQGRTLEAMREAQTAVEHEAEGTSLRANLTAHVAAAKAFAGDLRGAATAANDSVALADALHDNLIGCVARSYLGMALSGAADVTGGLALAREVRSRTERGVWHADLFLGLALLEADRDDEAEEAFRRGRRVSEDFGAAWNLPYYFYALAWLHFLHGHWEDAATEAEAGLVLAEELHARQGAICIHSILTVIAVRRNELESARRHMMRAHDMFAEFGPQHRAYWRHWAQAHCDEAGGDLPSAWSAIDRAWQSVCGPGLRSEYPLLGPTMVRLSRAAGFAEKALAASREVESAAAQVGTASAAAAADLCRGLVMRSPEVLAQAADLARGARRPMLLGDSLVALGSVLRDEGRRADAIDVLQQALAVYGQLRAPRDSARVHAILRSLGVRAGGRSGARRRSRTGWESLSRTESTVAQLVVQGLTNRDIAGRLFISPRTAETHVAHVFAKLGLRSRLELITMAAALGKLPQRL